MLCVFLSAVGYLSLPEQEEQVIPAQGTGQEGFEEPANCQDAYGRSESLSDVSKDKEAAHDSHCSVPELAWRTDGHSESGDYN